jgi:hypothetical protein
MECLLQYLDELDDLFGIIALCGERIRSVLLFVASTALFFGAVLGGVTIALSEPRHALAVAIALSILLLYRRISGARLQYAN